MKILFGIRLIKISVVYISINIMAVGLYGQEIKLIKQVPIDHVENYQKTKSELFLRETHASKFVSPVKIEMDRLNDDESFTLEFDDMSYVVVKNRIEVREIMNFTWFGKNQQGDGNIILTVSGDDIQGIITRGRDLYRIETTTNGEYYINKVDQSQFPDEMCVVKDSWTQQERDMRNFGYDQKELKDNEKANTPQLRSDGGVNDCSRIRVLVMYTPLAESEVTDMKNFVQSAIDVTNQSFINSSIDHRVQLAYAGYVEYTGNIDLKVDLTLFQGDGDNVMDQIHDLRDKFSADVCVLIVAEASPAAIPGVAYRPDDIIKGEPDKAFAVVKRHVAIDFYSFAHEIGHILGCRHDDYVDANDVPFEYGHGYVNLEKEWRTIMAYNNKCRVNNTDCTRLQYWSNPKIYFLGDRMGTFATNDNVRVWNEMGETIKGYRSLPHDVTLENANIERFVYGDAIATQSIDITGTLPIGSVLNALAPLEISLSEFESGIDSKVTLTVKNISSNDCIAELNENQSIISTKNTLNKRSTTTTVSNNIRTGTNANISYSIYPNPSSETVYVRNGNDEI